MLFRPHTRAGVLKPLDAKSTPLRDRLPQFFPPSPLGVTWIFVLCGWMLLVSASYATAQSTHTGAVSSAAHPAVSSRKKSASVRRKSKSTYHRKHRTARHPRRAKPDAVVLAPAPPPFPVPPANQPANPATVDFHQGLLSIHAQNSSLVAILNQISRETGLVVEGISHDQRIYGQYGPGNISTTLSALLNGSGYNYVIIGGGDHSPTQLVLSSSNGLASSPAAATSPTTAMQNGQPTPVAGEPSQPVADPTAPVRPKTPAEIFNELRRMHPQ